MHTEYDTLTRDNTLALYGVRHHGYAYRMVRGIARMVVAMAILAAVTILPHVIAYTLIPA